MDNSNNITFFDTLLRIRPYDATADLERVKVNIEKKDFKNVAPVIGIEIKKYSVADATAMNCDFDPFYELRKHVERAAREKAEKIDGHVWESLVDVGIDPNALAHTHEINRCLIEKCTQLAMQVDSLHISIEEIVKMSLKEFCNQLWPIFEHGNIDDDVKALWACIEDDIIQMIKENKTND